MRKRIALFGSTGSIGTQTLEVVRSFPNQLQVIGLAAQGNDLQLLEQQILEFSPKIVVVYDTEKAEILSKKIGRKVLSGLAGLIFLAREKAVDFVLMAMSTTIGIEPTVEAILQKKTIGLANKEILIAAGEWICPLAKENNVSILPIDSEHSALFQCLQGETAQEIRRLVLTASGGPFWTFSKEQMQKISKDQALKHPNWSMGQKITVDSSTLMNKGLEVIEAHYLFDVPIEKIDIVIHPESIIHSMIEFVDGSIKAQLSNPSMILPIQYALFYPKRIENPQIRFDFTRSQVLRFEKPPIENFPCLELAFEALKTKKSFPCYLNAANETLVGRFLNQEISWIEIGAKLKSLMQRHVPEELLDLRDVFDIECRAKQEAESC